MKNKERIKKAMGTASEQRENRKYVFGSAILSILAVNYYNVFLYFNNISEIKLSAVISPFIILGIVGITIWVLTVLVIRNIWSTAFWSALYCLIFANFALLESAVQKLIPVLRYWHIVELYIGLICIVGVCFRKKEVALLKELSKVLGIVLAGLLLINLIPNVGTFCQKIISVGSVRHESDGQTVLSTGKQNVYYFIFDEYASNSFMKKYYNYDNSGFTDWLENRGFQVSYSSRSDTYDTKIVVTNNVNLDYVVTSQTNEDEITKIRENNRLFEIFKANGYNIRTLSQSGFYGMPDTVTGENTDSTGVTNEGFSFSELVLKNTPFYIWIVNNNLDERLNYMNTALEYLTDPSNIVKEGNMLTLSHLILPHASFIYDQDGNTVSAAHLNDWQDPKYYRDQYIYTTKKMQEIVDVVLENDPEAIILLTSDHSARNMMSIETVDKSECFAAIYAPGIAEIEEEGIEGESVVNLLRKIVNYLFNMKMEMLERPSV